MMSFSLRVTRPFFFLFFFNRAGLGSLVAEEMKIPNRFVGLSKCKEIISQIYEL